MTQTLEERAKQLAAHCRNPEEMLEHLRAVERAAYERAAEIADQDQRPLAEDRWNRGYDAGRRQVAKQIRALADGGSDG